MLFFIWLTEIISLNGEMRLFLEVAVLFYVIEVCLSDNTWNGNDGGWFTDPSDVLAEAGPCNIDVRDATLTQQEFLDHYAFQQPVVINGLTDNSEFVRLSSRDSLLSNYANKVIRLSSANTYSYQKVDVTFEKYVTEILAAQRLDKPGNETLIWFGDNDHVAWADLFNAYHPPTLTLPGLTGAYSYGLAGAGTGVPFHFHGPGFAEVIYGRKRWFMYPPHERPEFHPNITTLHWTINNYPTLADWDKPLECTMLPGQVIYFPDHWWHATLNLDTSVFISTFLG